MVNNVMGQKVVGRKAVAVAVTVVVGHLRGLALVCSLV